MGSSVGQLWGLPPDTAGFNDTLLFVIALGPSSFQGVEVPFYLSTEGEMSLQSGIWTKNGESLLGNKLPLQPVEECCSFLWKRVSEGWLVDHWCFLTQAAQTMRWRQLAWKFPPSHACGGMRTHGQGSWQCYRGWGEIYPTLSTTDRQMGSTESNTEIAGKRLTLSVNQQEEDNPKVCDWGTLTSLSSVLFFFFLVFFLK